MNKRMLHIIHQNNNNKNSTVKSKNNWRGAVHHPQSVSHPANHPSMFIFIIFDKFPSISSPREQRYLCYLLSTLIQ